MSYARKSGPVDNDPMIEHNANCWLFLFPERQHKTLPEFSRQNKVMLRVILNRLVNQAEQISEEEQVGFRSQTSATEQIFSLRLLAGKHSDHQKELFPTFVDFKKAFDHVCMMVFGL